VWNQATPLRSYFDYADDIYNEADFFNIKHPVQAKTSTRNIADNNSHNEQCCGVARHQSSEEYFFKRYRKMDRVGYFFL